MGGRFSNRTALLAGGALAAALFGASVAFAQEAPAPATEASQTSVDQIDFTDNQTVLRRNVTMRSDVAQRFGPASGENEQAQGPRRVELEFAAGDGDLDVSFAQRASLGGENGDINRAGRGSEVRIGRGLVSEDSTNAPRGSSTYVFVASDDEALTWQPGQRSEFGGQGPSLQLQDRVEVGDMSVGVTYERSGVQASLAYVEREESTTIGRETFNQNESFTGLTVTMRR
ncbi:hypothetical protein [Candidatus Viadribacter manganicus]|uniref:hypothetical protein n=1 Tax=Candidatus Viadribacter manganicus TaxID=1759059 RepID=UPI0012E9BE3C|nr:hypothetical protein [Candidatus Viadribacter manganicus]